MDCVNQLIILINQRINHHYPSTRDDGGISKVVKVNKHYNNGQYGDKNFLLWEQSVFIINLKV